MLFFYDFTFNKSAVRRVFLEIGIVIGHLKKSYLTLGKYFDV